MMSIEIRKGDNLTHSAPHLARGAGKQASKQADWQVRTATG